MGWKKNTRATGLKKCQKARGDEPAESNEERFPRENEPGDVGHSHEAPRDDEPGSIDDEMWMSCDDADENPRSTPEDSVEKLLGSPVILGTAWKGLRAGRRKSQLKSKLTLQLSAATSCFTPLPNGLPNQPAAPCCHVVQQRPTFESSCC